MGVMLNTQGEPREPAAPEAFSVKGKAESVDAFVVAGA